MAAILKWLISLLVVSSASPLRSAKYASDTTSEFLAVVFIVKNINGLKTVDVIYKCHQAYGGVVGPFPIELGSNSNEYVIDYDSSEDASPVTEIREVCSDVTVADGDFRLLKHNPDGTLSTPIGNNMLLLTMVDADSSSVLRYRSPGMVLNMIFYTYGAQTGSDETHSSEATYGYLEPIFKCSGARLTPYTHNLKVYRDESEYPIVKYTIGDELELEYWEYSLKNLVRLLCGVDLQPDDLLHFFKATHTTVTTELEGKYIDLTVT